MKTSEILETCKAAYDEAKKLETNWSDAVDHALNTAGIETNTERARELLGKEQSTYNLIAVLEDGRYVFRWDDGRWSVEDADYYAHLDETEEVE